MRYLYYFVLLLTLVIASQPAFCQVDRGGVPRSFGLYTLQKSKLQAVEITSPDMFAIAREDAEDANSGKPYRVGVEIPVNISLTTAGHWDNIPGGGRIWRMALSCKGSEAIGLNYSNIRLPQGADIFVYTPDQSQVIGAITSEEIPRTVFSTRPLAGDQLIIEYYEPVNEHELPVIDISGIVYMYRSFHDIESPETKSTASGSCEVNINCEEGKNWQRQKQGAVKFLTKIGSSTFFCSGVVVNNTLQDFSGLILTAGHCSEGNGKYATADDYAHWIIYFNYERAGCSNTGVPAQLSLVGVEKLATSANLPDVGSDFLLLRSLKSIPAKYNAFYCGWDAGNNNSTFGVCIHHPDGDYKKISTYSSPLASASWGPTPGTHWQVKWVQTINGWGVTEGGSSGSPLFDDEGLVIGTLTGGPSSCSNPTGQDMFGKVSYSWTSNGTAASEQLKPWLDPGNTGILKMAGSYNENLAIADFSASSFVTPVGGTINFQDLSSGKPTKWHWYFQGGTPYESTEQNPTGIKFDRYGAMNVKLVVSNVYNADSIVKEKFIDVKAVVSPNPSKGSVNILTNLNNDNPITIEVYDALGKMAQRFEYTEPLSATYTINLPYSGNIFVVKIIQGDQVQTHKVVVVH